MSPNQDHRKECAVTVSDTPLVERREAIAREIDHHLRGVLSPGDLIWTKPGGTSVLAKNLSERILALLSQDPTPASGTVEALERARLFYLAMYGAEGGKWEAVDPSCHTVWIEKANRLQALKGGN